MCLSGPHNTHWAASRCSLLFTGTNQPTTVFPASLQLWLIGFWLHNLALALFYSGTPPTPFYWVIIFCTPKLDFFIPSCGNRWADTGPSNGWENNCHKVNFIACFMHLWAGGRCPLPKPWWMTGQPGLEWEWEGRGQTQAAGVSLLSPEIENFLTLSKLVFWYKERPHSI